MQRFDKNLYPCSTSQNMKAILLLNQPRKKKLKKQNATSNSPSYLQIFAHDAVLKSVRKEIIQRLSFHLRSLLSFTFSHHSQIHTVKTSASLWKVSFFA